MVGSVTNIYQQTQPVPQPQQLPLIDPRDIKAILYMGLRGEIILPVENHKVDILA